MLLSSFVSFLISLLVAVPVFKIESSSRGFLFLQVGFNSSDQTKFANVELDSAPKITALAFVDQSPSCKVLGCVPDILIVSDDFNDVL
eukprot:11182869-Heterocapsa_arctica.AAC.1